MKRFFLSLAMIAIIASMTMAQKIKGSDTVLPLAQKEAEAKENNPTYDIEAKAYKPKVKEESQIRKQGPGRG